MFNKHGVPRARMEVLRKVALFEGLSDRVLARIDSHIDEVDVSAGRELMVEGTGAYEAFIIEDGVAEVSVGGEVVGETSVGELIGEIGVLQKRPRTATVVSKTPMRLLVINPRDISWLFENRELAERVQQNMDRHLKGPQPT